MRRITALALLIPALLIGTPLPSSAGASTDAALALGSFAVLNQLLRGQTVLHDIFDRDEAYDRHPGKRERRRVDRGYDRDPGVYHPYTVQPSTRIPPGHLPPPGHCRVWLPDRPPGHQPPPTRC